MDGPGDEAVVEGGFLGVARLQLVEHDRLR